MSDRMAPASDLITETGYTPPPPLLGLQWLCDDIRRNIPEANFNSTTNIIFFGQEPYDVTTSSELNIQSKIIQSFRGNIIAASNANYGATTHDETDENIVYVESSKLEILKVRSQELNTTLRDNYIIFENDKVIDFILEHQFLETLLVEAPGQIYRYFRSPDLYIEYFDNYDCKQKQLVVVISPKHEDPEEALSALDDFDNAWWLSNFKRSKDLLFFSVEYKK